MFPTPAEREGLPVGRRASNTTAATCVVSAGCREGRVIHRYVSGRTRFYTNTRSES